MSVAALEKFDAVTAANVLAAAALRAAPDAGIGDKAFEDRYAEEADAVLEEISNKLNIKERNSNAFRSALSATLARELKLLLVPGEVANDALSRAGQAGRLAPSIYKVIQSKAFREQFAPLGVSKDQVQAAVHRPDDYQHLMTQYGVPEGRDTISLFMKLMLPRDNDAYWLLVQTHRVATEQQAQSAWRIYASEVDLDGASEPLHVLKSFVTAFGLPISVNNNKEALFIEDALVPLSNTKVTWKGKGLETFMSISGVKDTANQDMMHVGVGYAINIVKYRAALIKHKVIKQ